MQANPSIRGTKGGIILTLIHITNRLSIAFDVRANL